MWRPQLDWFASRGFRVITPDLRGDGASAVTSGKVTPGKVGLDVFATDLRDLLDKLGLDRECSGGLSMGGQIVLEFHRLYADRLAGSVIAASSARADDEAAQRFRRDTADRIVREGMAAYAAELLPKMVAAASPRQVADRVSDMMRNAPVEGAAAALRGRAERPDYVELLPKIDVPTLVVVGTEDEFTPVAEAELMAGQIGLSVGSPGATLEVIDGAGHLPNLERPEDFNAVLEEFLSRFCSHPLKASRPAAESVRPRPTRNRSAGTGLRSEAKMLAGSNKTLASSTRACAEGLDAVGTEVAREDHRTHRPAEPTEKLRKLGEEAPKRARLAATMARLRSNSVVPRLDRDPRQHLAGRRVADRRVVLGSFQPGQQSSVAAGDPAQPQAGQAVRLRRDVQRNCAARTGRPPAASVRAPV